MISALLAVLFGLFGNVACAGPCTSPGGVAYLSAVNLATPSLNSGLNTTIPNGGSATLTWDAPGALSCAGTGFSTGASPGIGSVVVSPTTTTTYSVNCGQNTASATVTVSGTRIDAAATYCAANGGGDGSSGSPWQDRCIQAALNAAASGDTIFLAAGNWALNLSTATPTGNISTTVNPNQITNLSSVAGIVVGETVVDATANQGNIAIPDYTPPTTVTAINSGCTAPCVVLSQNVTATRTGDTFGFGWGIRTGTKSINLVGAGSGNTLDYLGHPSNPSGGPVGTVAPGGTVTRVFTTGTNTGNGDPAGYISFGNYDNLSSTTGCAGGSPVATASHIYFDGSIKQGVRNYGAGFLEVGDYDGTFNIQSCANATINDVRYVGFNSANAQFFVRDSNNFTLLNSVLAMPVASGTSYAAGETIQYQEFHDGLIKNNAILAQTTNNIVTSNVTYTGNYTFYGCDNIACSTSAAGYGPAGCGLGFCYAEGGSSDMTGSHHFFNTNNYFSMSNTGSAGTGTNNAAIGAGVNDPTTNGIWNDLEYTGNWLTGGAVFLTSCVWRGGAGTPIDGETCGPSGITSGGMQVNSPIFANNSVIGTISANIDFRGNGCPAAGTTHDDGTGPADCPNGVNPLLHELQCVNCSATKNYLSSPANAYLNDSNTVTPTVSGNFCANTGTFAGCTQTGFNTPPTVSFTLGTLHNDPILGNAVPINSPTFTAQYGAVKWLASTSPTTPTSGDSRWACLPTGAQNACLPPVSIAVSHGNTVYMWVMDSGNNVSSVASAVVP